MRRLYFASHGRRLSNRPTCRMVGERRRLAREPDNDHLQSLTPLGLRLSLCRQHPQGTVSPARAHESACLESCLEESVTTSGHMVVTDESSPSGREELHHRPEQYVRKCKSETGIEVDLSP